jgi:hypothetical protein
MQVARLYTRGTLCNETAKNLTPPQRKRVDEVVEEVISDPTFQPSKRAFINALGNTIRSEYLDPVYADQEVYVAVWRAAVSALYHKPEPEVLINQIQRIKFFKTWLFNYLRQIVNENKIFQVKSTTTVNGLNSKLGAQVLSSFLIERNVPVIKVLTESDRHAIVHTEILRLSLSDQRRYSQVQRLLNRNGLEIQYNHRFDEVHLRTDKPRLVSMDVPTAINIKLVSFETTKAGDGEDDGRIRHTLEYKIASEASNSEFRRIEFNDLVERLKESLPPDARQVLKIFVKPPKDFTDEFGDDTRQKTIARFLHKTPKEIARLLDRIRLHCLGFGYVSDR